MSKSLSSPTARLLQSSRLFSLPRPLPPPVHDAAAGGNEKQSPTATLPYPTRQAITTPASSLFRGDFGLKRPLPAKSTKRTSTPHIRVKAQDNFEHITAFESAADHTLTEAKWREMGIPISVKLKDAAGQKQLHSVYEDHLDHTDPNAVNTRSEDWRWKRSGPYLAGMSTGEFELYLTTQISARKGEFRKFLQQRSLEKRVSAEKQQLRDRGETAEVAEERREELRREIVDSYPEFEKALRDEHAGSHLSSELTRAICNFLDLSAFVSNQDNGMDETRRSLMAASGLETSAPPSTHPGAGLSYLRTNAVLDNHSLYGPQLRNSPVLARTLKPRGSGGQRVGAHDIGVGGVVALDRETAQDNNTRRRNFSEQLTPEEKYMNRSLMLADLDPDLPGGNKYWVHPQSATISEGGRIRLNVVKGHEDAVLIKRGLGEQVMKSKTGQIGQSSTRPQLTGFQSAEQRRRGQRRDDSTLQQLDNLIDRKLRRN